MDAPNFVKNYPLSGERIGPLWRELWSALADGVPMSATLLAERFAARHRVADGTVKGLLWNAAKYGHLERAYRNDETKLRTRRVYYHRVLS